MSSFDLLIKNGTVVDGSGSPRYQADVGISDGKIVSIGELSSGDAQQVIDAEGKIVAPGIVDTHTHYDAQIFRDPDCADDGANGITSIVTTNCGFGFAPCKPEHQDRYMIMMENVEQIPVAHQRASLPWDWESYPEFLSSLSRTPKGVNVMAYVPLNALMIYVMGIDEAKSRPATDEELSEMKRLLNEAMDAGAIGLSLSAFGKNNVHLDYDGTQMPADLISIEQACEIASVLKERNQGVVQCLCGAPGVDKTVEMSVALAESTGRPVLHNLIPIINGTPLHELGMNWLDEMKDKGLNMWAASFCSRMWTEVSVDSAVVLDVEKPFQEISYAESNEQRKVMLESEEFRARLRECYSAEKFAGVGGCLEGFTVISGIEGTELADLGKSTLGEYAQKVDKQVTDLYADILLASDFKAVFKASFTPSPDFADPEIVKQVFLHDRVIPGGSDGGAHLKIFSGGHWGTDFLVHLVRETDVITLEQAHHKLSGASMQFFGVPDRGMLKEGMIADVIVYSLDELYVDTEGYTAINDLPDNDWRKQAIAGGYAYKIVNGQVTYEGRDKCGPLPGLMLSS